MSGSEDEALEEPDASVFCLLVFLWAGMFLCISSLSIYMLIHVCIWSSKVIFIVEPSSCLGIYPCSWLFVSLFLCLFVSLSLCLFVCVSLYLYSWLFVGVFVCFPELAKQTSAPALWSLPFDHRAHSDSKNTGFPRHSHQSCLSLDIHISVEG